MRQKIRNVLVIVNPKKDDASEIVQQIEAFLKEEGIVPWVFSYTDDLSRVDLDKIDLAFSLGGDGTVLFSARVLAPKGIPILAVNLGDFGFITEVSKGEWRSAFEKYRRGGLGISERIMLEVRVIREGIPVARFNGLNDSVISSAGISKIVRLDVSLADDRLGEYRADGVIIATPTGSTAYSMASGGPILDPEMEAMIINPICPFTLSNRTIVVPGNQKITVEVMQQQRTDIILTIDGQNSFTLRPEDRVEFMQAKEKAVIIHSDKRTFYEVLRSKLKWSGGPDA